MPIHTTTSPARPRVTSVTIGVVYPDGHTGNYTFDPAITAGVFWHELTVLEMLSAWYKQNPQTKSRAELVAALGEKLTGRIMGNKPQVTMTDQTIKDLWDLQEDGNYLVGVLGKTIVRAVSCPQYP